jgi:hypothetical protein
MFHIPFQMSKWMNEWMSEWMNEWMSEWVSEWVNSGMSDCHCTPGTEASPAHSGWGYENVVFLEKWEP